MLRRIDRSKSALTDTGEFFHDAIAGLVVALAADVRAGAAALLGLAGGAMPGYDDAASLDRKLIRLFLQEPPRTASSSASDPSGYASKRGFQPAARGLTLPRRPLSVLHLAEPDSAGNVPALLHRQRRSLGLHQSQAACSSRGRRVIAAGTVTLAAPFSAAR